MEVKDDGSADNSLARSSHMTHHPEGASYHGLLSCNWGES